MNRRYMRDVVGFGGNVEGRSKAELGAANEYFGNFHSQIKVDFRRA